jgi:uncharacterized protein (DUF2235 family)
MILYRERSSHERHQNQMQIFVRETSWKDASYMEFSILVTLWLFGSVRSVGVKKGRYNLTTDKMNGMTWTVCLCNTNNSNAS